MTEISTLFLSKKPARVGAEPESIFIMKKTYLRLDGNPEEAPFYEEYLRFMRQEKSAWFALYSAETQTLY